MRDPIDELGHFDLGDLPVTPLSATEVRRRGDRLRRRRQALGAVAGVAAVLVIATPLAVFAGRGGGGDQEIPPVPEPTAVRTPTPNEVEWLRRIPDTFPLDAGLPGTPRPMTERFTVGVCGGPMTIPTVRDSASVYSSPDTEGGYSRRIAVFADESAARQVSNRLEVAVAECGTSPDHSIDPLPAPLGPDSFAWVDRERDDGGQLNGVGQIIEVLRVGNAVLVLTSSVNSAGDAAVVRVQADRLARDASRPASAMCAFAAGGCSGE